MSELVIMQHFGLGDAIAANAIVRHYASKHEKIILLCDDAFEPSVKFMFRDIQVETMGFSKEDDAAQWFGTCGKPKAGIGRWGKNFSESAWLEAYYEQNDLPVSDRWAKFYVERFRASELKPPSSPYVFVHDCPYRGFLVERKRLRHGLLLVYPCTPRGGNIFNNWAMIEHAAEIHCIDSCFLNLVESIDTGSASLFFHKYAKPYPSPPVLAKDWEILE